jgi:hypothetical protein
MPSSDDDDGEVMSAEALMERRRSIRQTPLVARAFVYLDRRLPLIECDVLNISDGGAHIVVHSEQMLPAHFVLFFTPDGSERRTCRVIWRNGSDIGVAFEGLD